MNVWCEIRGSVQGREYEFIQILEGKEMVTLCQLVMRCLCVCVCVLCLYVVVVVARIAAAQQQLLTRFAVDTSCCRCRCMRAVLY